MKLNVTYKKAGAATPAIVDIPDECPTCGRLINFPFNNSSLTASGELQTVHVCTFNECRSLMICYHEDVHATNIWKLRKTEPPKLSQISFPDFVAEISPSFTPIYKQAVEAKERGLSEIAGAGYRKAFEFLIKDYAKSKSQPKDFDSIVKQQASAVVNNYIKFPSIQAVAKRALWLGNDETHYLRKWEDKDITDLIALIKLTIEWIDIERTSASYIDEMPEPTKP